MRVTLIALFVLASLLSNAVANPQLSASGKRPANCIAFKDYSRFLDRKAAERVAAAGYERFAILEGSFGGANSYTLTIEVLPRGYTTNPRRRVLSVKAVLNSPSTC